MIIYVSAPDTTEVLPAIGKTDHGVRGTHSPIGFLPVRGVRAFQEEHVLTLLGILRFLTLFTERATTLFPFTKDSTVLSIGHHKRISGHPIYQFLVRFSYSYTLNTAPGLTSH